MSSEIPVLSKVIRTSSNVKEVTDSAPLTVWDCQTQCRTTKKSFNTV